MKKVILSSVIGLVLVSSFSYGSNATYVRSYCVTTAKLIYSDLIRFNLSKYYTIDDIYMVCINMSDLRTGYIPTHKQVLDAVLD